MSDYVRVRDVSTGHEYTVAAKRFDPGAHVKLDKPATGPDRLPLGVKYRINRRASVAPKPVPAVADAPDNTDGQKAESEKENR